MSGDNLTICLFFGGLAVSFAGVALSQTGWRHWLLITTLFALALISAAIGAAWPWARDWSPLLQKWITAVGTSPISWFAVMMFLITILLVGKKAPIPLQPSGHTRHLGAPALAAPLGQGGVSGPNTQANALKIELGTDDRFERVETFPGVIRRIIYVAVRNAGNGFLSDCKLSVKAITPDQQAKHIPAALAYNFGLATGEYRFVPIVGYAEKISNSSDPVNDLVIVSVPHTAGFYSGPTTVAASDRDQASIFTLEASALECKPCIMHFRVWVDKRDRRLRMEAV